MTQDKETLAGALQPAPRSRKSSLTLIATLLCAALACGTIIYEMQVNRTLRKELANSQYWQNQLQALTVRQQQIEAKQTLSDVRQSEDHSQQASLVQMYESLTRVESARPLAEIEQILVFASQQLQLTGNTAPAVSALASIDQKLANLNRPEYINLRRVLSKDLEALRNLPPVDVIGISARLDNLIETADKLPLAIETHRDAPKPTPVAVASGVDKLSRIGGELWHDVKQLIQIRRMDKPDAMLLTPEQSFFLRENIKLRLLHTRAALLSRDDKIFHSELAAVKNYLNAHFDLHAQTVLNTLETLKKMEQVQLNLAAPDLASSLTAIRTVRQQTERIKP